MKRFYFPNTNKKDGRALGYGVLIKEGEAEGTPLEPLPNEFMQTRVGRLLVHCHPGIEWWSHLRHLKWARVPIESEASEQGKAPVWKGSSANLTTFFAALYQHDPQYLKRLPAKHIWATSSFPDKGVNNPFKLEPVSKETLESKLQLFKDFCDKHKSEPPILFLAKEDWETKGKSILERTDLTFEYHAFEAGFPFQLPTQADKPIICSIQETALDEFIDWLVPGLRPPPFRASVIIGVMSIAIAVSILSVVSGSRWQASLPLLLLLWFLPFLSFALYKSAQHWEKRFRAAGRFFEQLSSAQVLKVAEGAIADLYEGKRYQILANEKKSQLALEPDENKDETSKIPQPPRYISNQTAKRVSLIAALVFTPVLISWLFALRDIGVTTQNILILSMQFAVPIVVINICMDLLSLTATRYLLAQVKEDSPLWLIAAVIIADIAVAATCVTLVLLINPNVLVWTEMSGSVLVWPRAVWDQSIALFSGHVNFSSLFVDGWWAVMVLTTGFACVTSCLPSLIHLVLVFWFVLTRFSKGINQHISQSLYILAPVGFAFILSVPALYLVFSPSPMVSTIHPFGDRKPARLDAGTYEVQTLYDPCFPRGIGEMFKTESHDTCNRLRRFREILFFGQKKAPYIKEIYRKSKKYTARICCKDKHCKKKNCQYVNIGRYEVTQRLWRSVVRRDQKGANQLKVPMNPSIYNKGANFPVGNVSWCTSLRWINLLNKQLGKTGFYYEQDDKRKAKRYDLPNCNNLKSTKKQTGRPIKSCNLKDECRPGSALYQPKFSDNGGYRLCTLDEWLVAAQTNKSGKRLPFRLSGGNNPNNVANIGLVKSSQPMQVGQFSPNARGIFDLSGNIREWLFDHCKCGSRFLMGGASDHSVISSDVRFLDHRGRQLVDDYIGIRLCRSAK